jgi:hypothetical protein
MGTSCKKQFFLSVTHTIIMDYSAFVNSIDKTIINFLLKMVINQLTIILACAILVSGGEWQSCPLAFAARGMFRGVQRLLQDSRRFQKRE